RGIDYEGSLEPSVRSGRRSVGRNRIRESDALGASFESYAAFRRNRLLLQGRTANLITRAAAAPASPFFNDAYPERIVMDTTTTNPITSTAGTRAEGLAQSAHRTVDDVTGRLSGAAHRAVDSAADVATTASEWASNLPDQAKSAQARFSEAA